MDDVKLTESSSAPAVETPSQTAPPQSAETTPAAAPSSGVPPPPPAAEEQPAPAPVEIFLIYPQDSVAAGGRNTVVYGNPCVCLFALGTSIAEFHDFFSRDPP